MPATNDNTTAHERWIVENLDPSRPAPYTFKDCARDHALSHQYVRELAAKFKWREDLRERQRKLSENAIEKAQEAFATDEAEVRATHAKMLGQLSGALWNKLVEAGGLDIDKLTEKQKAEILVLMIKGQRDALGLPTTTRLEHGIGGDPTQREMQGRLREFMTRMQSAAEAEPDPLDEGEDVGGD